MNELRKDLSQERISLAGMLAGLWPFIFLGPILAIIPYIPGLPAQLKNLDTDFELFLIPCLFGLIAGWLKGFPRWSYPYVTILFYIAFTFVMARFSLLLGPNRFDRPVASALFLAGFLILGAGFVMLVCFTAPLRKIYTDSRQDWTRLSFGLFTIMALFVGFYGGDALPPFGWMVMLPPLIILLGAFAHLLSQNRPVRILSLALPILVVLSINKPGEDQVNFWAFSLILIIFLPALLGLKLRQKPI